MTKSVLLLLLHHFSGGDGDSGSRLPFRGVDVQISRASSQDREGIRILRERNAFRKKISGSITKQRTTQTRTPATTGKVGQAGPRHERATHPCHRFGLCGSSSVVAVRSIFGFMN
uniref:Putative secreted protein n=1 Tax=Anopheles marajoara TaxID=58244 RepID=A0A2M4C7P6_9DIPT